MFQYKSTRKSVAVWQKKKLKKIIDEENDMSNAFVLQKSNWYLTVWCGWSTQFSLLFFSFQFQILCYWKIKLRVIGIDVEAYVMSRHTINKLWAKGDLYRKINLVSRRTWWECIQHTLRSSQFFFSFAVTLFTIIILNRDLKAQQKSNIRNKSVKESWNMRYSNQKQRLHKESSQ